MHDKYVGFSTRISQGHLLTIKSRATRRGEGGGDLSETISCSECIPRWIQRCAVWFAAGSRKWTHLQSIDIEFVYILYGRSATLPLPTKGRGCKKVKGGWAVLSMLQSYGRGSALEDLPAQILKTTLRGTAGSAFGREEGESHGRVFGSE
jgi:hypothetical protein